MKIEDYFELANLCLELGKKIRRYQIAEIIQRHGTPISSERISEVFNTLAGQEHKHFIYHKVDLYQLLDCPETPPMLAKQYTLGFDNLVADVVEWTRLDYGHQN